MRRSALATCTLAAALIAPMPAAPAAAAGPGQQPPPFPVGAPADYQLGGAYAGRDLGDVRHGAVIVRDRTDPPADPSGKRGGFDVCYLNAFQTQPISLRWWRRTHPDLLLREDGRLVRDPGWRAEVLLDTRRREARVRIARIVGRWARGCARDGYEAVELDNLDSFGRSRGLLQRVDNLALARMVVRRVHAGGLAVAQKNLAGLRPAAVRRIGFDFAIAEECQRYDECAAYARAHGRRIVEIEYRRSDFEAACARHGGRWAVLLRDRALRPAGEPGHVREMC